MLTQVVVPKFFSHNIKSFIGKGEKDLAKFVNLLVVRDTGKRPVSKMIRLYLPSSVMLKLNKRKPNITVHYFFEEFDKILCSF